jgi:hypothetical protein
MVLYHREFVCHLKWCADELIEDIRTEGKAFMVFVTFLACPKKGDPIPATWGPGFTPGMGQSREVDLL